LVTAYTEDVFFSEYISYGIVFRFGRMGPSKQHEHMKAHTHTHNAAQTRKVQVKINYSQTVNQTDYTLR